MVRIPHIKIPSVRVGGIDPTSDIGTAIGGVLPTPITYLTNWKIVGNSEVHGNEIWSCGEYSAVDGKYHILVQPLGGSIADIALTEPLRKVNDVADTIEFPSETEGKALVTRNLVELSLSSLPWKYNSDQRRYLARNNNISAPLDGELVANILSSEYSNVPFVIIRNNLDEDKIIAGYTYKGETQITLRDKELSSEQDIQGLIIVEALTPTTELVDAPQIQEAESYSCVISQGAKAVSWSEFLYYSGYLLTDSENNLLVDSENYQLTVQS